VWPSCSRIVASAQSSASRAGLRRQAAPRIPTTLRILLKCQHEGVCKPECRQCVRAADGCMLLRVGHSAAYTYLLHAHCLHLQLLDAALARLPRPCVLVCAPSESLALTLCVYTHPTHLS
jgi:hypothetical protein